MRISKLFWFFAFLALAALAVALCVAATRTEKSSASGEDAKSVAALPEASGKQAAQQSSSSRSAKSTARSHARSSRRAARLRSAARAMGLRRFKQVSKAERNARAMRQPHAFGSAPNSSTRKTFRERRSMPSAGAIHCTCSRVKSPPPTISTPETEATSGQLETLSGSAQQSSASELPSAQVSNSYQEGAQPLKSNSKESYSAKRPSQADDSYVANSEKTLKKPEPKLNIGSHGSSAAPQNSGPSPIGLQRSEQPKQDPNAGESNSVVRPEEGDRKGVQRSEDEVEEKSSTGEQGDGAASHSSASTGAARAGEQTNQAGGLKLSGAARRGNSEASKPQASLPNTKLVGQAANVEASVSVVRSNEENDDADKDEADDRSSASKQVEAATLSSVPTGSSGQVGVGAGRAGEQSKKTGGQVLAGSNGPFQKSGPADEGNGDKVSEGLNEERKDETKPDEQKEEPQEGQQAKSAESSATESTANFGASAQSSPEIEDTPEVFGKDEARSGAEGATSKPLQSQSEASVQGDNEGANDESLAANDVAEPLTVAINLGTKLAEEKLDSDKVVVSEARSAPLRKRQQSSARKLEVKVDEGSSKGARKIDATSRH